VVESGLLGLILAHDIAKPALTITPRDTLLTAMTKMTDNDSEALVVVEANNPKRPQAVLSHDRVIQAYTQEIFASR